jgi:hypothetical protein
MDAGMNHRLDIIASIIAIVGVWSFGMVGALAFDKYVERPVLERAERARVDRVERTAGALEAFIRCANRRPEFLTISGIEPSPVGIVCWRTEEIR